MTRRRHDEERINHDRWLISYADFITLLFAFFVVMYSLSSLNEGKYRAMSNSLVLAFGKYNTFSKNPTITAPTLNPGPGSGTGQGIGNGPRPGLSTLKKKVVVEEPLREERQKMTDLAQGIFNTLAPLIREGKVRVTQTSRGISIDINASVLFASGEAKLTPKSSEALVAIASVLENDTHDIQVEGFTDNQPIKSGVFPSNWELSAMRAGSVVRLFIDNGVAEDRLTAIGQGPKMAVGSNDTAEGRARNRRVNITILAVLPEKKTELPINENPHP